MAESQCVKIGFADAVREHGDGWTYAEQFGQISASTLNAMRERGHWQDALRMSLCETSENRLFQVERPLYRCGCDGLCAKHPDCPGDVYQQGYPYKNFETPQSG
jgi:hypothetical protein